ncbi:hypothetical protein HPQ64_18915 [Rhizobiales bacterium]|uniref:hypothetical protein n=1 Tax=Hongsoonwoonella zoysiae TaxID=2821844 RepID=UPI00156035DE|nr:hypothetical protein [Hongsoonwoonella zoysiae]NRG19768.1 hypothetical protein [Hongsoonwoonella zoysiae]
MVRTHVLVVSCLALAACQSGSGSRPPAYLASAPQAEPAVAAHQDGSQLPASGPFSLVPETTATLAPSLATSAQPVTEASYRPALAGVDLGELTRGYWRVVSFSGCGLRFGHPGAAGAPVSASGCGASSVANASAWTASGDTLRLLDASGVEVATLFVDRPDLLTGYTPSGADIVLSR